MQDSHVCVWQHVSGRNYPRRRSRGGIRGGTHHQGQTDGAAATRHPRCCPFCRTQGLLGLLSLRPLPTLCRLWKHVSCLVVLSCGPVLCGISNPRRNLFHTHLCIRCVLSSCRLAASRRRVVSRLLCRVLSAVPSRICAGIYSAHIYARWCVS